MIEETANLERKMPGIGIDCVVHGRRLRPIRQQGDETARTQFLDAHVFGETNDAQSGKGCAFQPLQIVDGKPPHQVDRLAFTLPLEHPGASQPMKKTLMVVEVLRLTSSNRIGFGADGVTVDGEGNLYTSVIEDGVIYKNDL